MRARSAVARALLALLLASCRDRPRAGEPDAAPRAESDAAAPRERAPSAVHELTPPHPPISSSSPANKPPACRIVSGEGGPWPSADASAWIALPEKSSFSVRVVESGKELRFEGPGRVRACGADVALVAEGTAIALPGAGEAPGNEQWVATPCAVARWASGIHRLTTEKDGCSLRSSTGTAWLWLPEGARLEDAPIDGGQPAGAASSPPSSAGPPDGGTHEAIEGWWRIDARRAVRIRGGAPSPVPAVLACERAASDVAALAAKMADGGSLGELMPASIAARRYARAACALASARVERAKAAELEPRVAKAAARL